MLSVVIPVYNEVATIAEIVSKVQAVPLEKELIIVDDYSTDGTRELLSNIKKEDNVKIIYHEENLGKGAALKTGFKNVKGDIALIQDADLEYDPEEYSKLIKPILDGKADAVYGSRFMGGDAHRVFYFWHMVGNKTLTLFSNMLSNLTLSDMETCYKVFTKEVLDKIEIEEKRFGIEPEITAKLAKMDVRIFEVGISYYGRSYKEGKKIGWKDGVSAIRAIIKYNLLR